MTNKPKSTKNFELILITDDMTAASHKALLDTFENLYNNGFPDADEREDFSMILERTCSEKEVPRTAIVLYYALNTQQVLGGIVADWYSMGFLHLTYIIVDPQARKRGIAKELMAKGIPTIIEHLSTVENVTIRSNFFESNNPQTTTIDNFDPKIRLKIFSDLGAKIIPIDYIQPSLGEGKEKVLNLLLLTFSQFNANEANMRVEDIIDFLTELYRACKNEENCPDLQAMARQLSNFGEHIDLKSC